MKKEVIRVVINLLNLPLNELHALHASIAQENIWIHEVVMVEQYKSQNVKESLQEECSKLHIEQ